jgi:hypothetical protein
MRSSARRMIAVIEGFFQRYASAAEARGVDALASFHHAPFLHVHGDGRVECLPTHEAVLEFFLVLSGKYAERDHGGGRFLDLEVKPLGLAAALASLSGSSSRLTAACTAVSGAPITSFSSTPIGKSWSRRLMATNALPRSSPALMR